METMNVRIETAHGYEISPDASFLKPLQKTAWYSGAQVYEIRKIERQLSYQV